MTIGLDQFDLQEAAPANGRDLPLSFRWRSHPNAVAGLTLPNANAHYTDARNAILTEALLVAKAGLSVSYSSQPTVVLPSHNLNIDPQTVVRLFRAITAKHKAVADAV